MNAFPSITVTEESIRVHGIPLKLTALEFVVLRTLVMRQADGRHDLTTFQVLQTAVVDRFPKSAQAESNVLQVVISRLRKKLHAAGARVSICGIRNMGYRLIAAEAIAA